MKRGNLIIITLFLAGCSMQGPYFKPGENSRNNYLNAHPEKCQEIRQGIISGQVVIGMSKDDVIATWGKPDKIFPEGTPRFKYQPQPWNEEWDWHGDLSRTMSQNCTVTFQHDIVINVQNDGLWK